MELPDVAKLTMEEEGVKENVNIRSRVIEYLSAKYEMFRGLEEVKAKVTSPSLLISASIACQAFPKIVPQTRSLNNLRICLNLQQYGQNVDPGWQMWFSSSLRSYKSIVRAWRYSDQQVNRCSRER